MDDILYKKYNINLISRLNNFFITCLLAIEPENMPHNYGGLKKKEYLSTGFWFLNSGLYCLMAYY